MITDSQSSGSQEQDGSICRGASIRSGFLSDLSRQKSIEQKEKVGVQIEESKFSGESSPTLKIAQDPKSLSLPPIQKELASMQDLRAAHLNDIKE